VEGLVVPTGNVEKAAEAIEKLINDAQMRNRYGTSGILKVKTFYDWNKNVDQMISIYNNIIYQFKK
jgi:glycosyltransferase involved in cell wall biosynthesis